LFLVHGEAEATNGYTAPDVVETSSVYGGAGEPTPDHDTATA